MKTREKLLVGTMLGAFCFAIYNSFGTKQEIQSKAKKASFLSNLEKTKEKLKLTSLSQTEISLLVRAQSSPTTNPFIKGLTPREQEQENKKVDGKIKEQRKEYENDRIVNFLHFTYSCYIQSGDKSVAVVNNTDVCIGDQIVNSDYYVKEISEKEVTLTNKSGDKIIVVEIYKQQKIEVQNEK